MAKKENRVIPMRDKIMSTLSVLSGLFTLLSVIPYLPWRMSDIVPDYQQRFSMPRKYSLYGATDNLGQLVSWMKLRSDVCAAVKTYQTSNPLTTLLGTVASSSLGTGGAIMGCANWPICKAHAVVRCNGYSTLAILGIMCMLLSLLGTVGGFLVPMFLQLEAVEGKGKKKEKKEAEAKVNTMCACITTFAVPLVSGGLWWGMSTSTFESFQANSFFPMPVPSYGAYMAGVGLLLGLVAMYLGITRIYPLFKVPEAEPAAEEEYIGQEQESEFPQGTEFPQDLVIPGLAPPPPIS